MHHPAYHPSPFQPPTHRPRHQMFSLFYQFIARFYRLELINLFSDLKKKSIKDYIDPWTWVERENMNRRGTLRWPFQWRNRLIAPVERDNQFTNNSLVLTDQFWPTRCSIGATENSQTSEFSKARQWTTNFDKLGAHMDPGEYCYHR